MREGRTGSPVRPFCGGEGKIVGVENFFEKKLANGEKAWYTNQGFAVKAAG